MPRAGRQAGVCGSTVPQLITRMHGLFDGLYRRICLSTRLGKSAARTAKLGYNLCLDCLCFRLQEMVKGSIALRLGADSTRSGLYPPMKQAVIPLHPSCAVGGCRSPPTAIQAVQKQHEYVAALICPSPKQLSVPTSSLLGMKAADVDLPGWNAQSCNISKVSARHPVSVQSGACKQTKRKDRDNDSDSRECPGASVTSVCQRWLKWGPGGVPGWHAQIRNSPAVSAIQCRRCKAGYSNILKGKLWQTW